MLIKGFKAGAIEAGLRYHKRFDLGLIVAEPGATAAGVFTTSLAPAAPVIWSRKIAAAGRARAILANAGQANAQTGAQGLEDCRRSAELVAEAAGFTPEEVLLASTGVIGQPLKMDSLALAVGPLAAKLSPDGLDDFAQAIMTTDTVAKTARGETVIGGRTVSLWGTAKGSGMIAPNMATLLSFVLTDAAVSPAALKKILAEVTGRTFNRLTIDGDTSTNDTCLIFASGQAGPEVIDNPASPEAALFQAALFTLMNDLSRQVAADGEGANHLVTIKVVGARTPGEAAQAARTVAESPLVKTALFGQDANWGRILAALGRSGAWFDPYQVDIDLNEAPWIRNGLDNGREKEAAAVMALKEYVITINLNAGPAEDQFLTCDLSCDYVKINASYRS